MDFIRVAADNWHFEEENSHRPFVPVGVNYCGYVASAQVGERRCQVFPLFGTDEHTLADGLAEAERAFSRLADLGLNTVRTWLQPRDIFPLGLQFDAEGADRLDALIAGAKAHGIRLSLSMTLSPHGSAGSAQGVIRELAAPQRERYLELLALLGQRYGAEPAILSWTLVGEGTLPWEHPWLAAQWPAWLDYWYDGDLSALRAAWGPEVVVPGFAEAPLPPRNLGATLPLGACAPGNLNALPDDCWAGSSWRYDYRLFLEEIGSRWVHEQARVLRAAGARQMTTVGNNSWIFPGLAAGQMALGFNPYFYRQSVDYFCQHNYPAPQCLPGGNGDPLDNAEAMRFWLTANEVLGRIYGSMGKPVMLEEWGWYGGGASNFLNALPYRSEEEQVTFCERMMETSQTCFAGWCYWQWRDMPRAGDITNLSALYAADGNRVKPWGRRYAEWAAKLQTTPPQRAAAKSTLELPMKMLYTSDRFHETWWQQTCRDYAEKGPLDFRPVFERKPLVTTEVELSDASGTPWAQIV